MTEVFGTTSAGRPQEVSIAIFLLVINALLGLFVAGVGLAVFEDALSATGIILAIFALWVAKGMMDNETWAWNMAILLNLIAVPLYFVSFAAIEGIFLSLLTLVYLNLPSVKQHFV